MKKTILIIICVILAITILATIAFAVMSASPLIVVELYMLFLPNPPRPEVKYAEFPFELVYEVEGEIISVKDFYVCKFTGFEANAGSMQKHRKWDGYVKSTGEDYIIIIQDGDLIIKCFVGDAGYYMGDPEYADWYTDEYPNEPDIHIDRINALDIFTEEDELEIMDKYKIKIISWKFSDPIENSFS